MMPGLNKDIQYHETLDQTRGVSLAPGDCQLEMTTKIFIGGGSMRIYGLIYTLYHPLRVSFVMMN